MGEAVTIGLDLAKSVFQVHGVDAAGKIVIQRQLKRAKVLDFFAKIPRCLVGMEACAAAHFWGRELRNLGHDARLMPPSYVKAYVKRQKNDAADAEAICEAAKRPSMRFVPVKTEVQQANAVLFEPGIFWWANARNASTLCAGTCWSMATSFRRAPPMLRA
jgi:transposase